MTSRGGGGASWGGDVVRYEGRLALVASAAIDGWYLVERFGPDGSRGGRGGRGPDLRASVEGDAGEMLALAEAVASRGRYVGGRCAVLVNGDRVLLWSPRNGGGSYASVPLGRADALAAEIRAALGGGGAMRVVTRAPARVGTSRSGYALHAGSVALLGGGPEDVARFGAAVSAESARLGAVAEPDGPARWSVRLRPDSGVGGGADRCEVARVLGDVAEAAREALGTAARAVERKPRRPA